MRAQSWYMQQNRPANCERDCRLGNCRCDDEEKERELPMKCIEHVPARAAHTKIVPGILFSDTNAPVQITCVMGKTVGLSVGYKDAGAWSKSQLKGLGQALLQLSEYMED